MGVNHSPAIGNFRFFLFLLSPKHVAQAQLTGTTIHHPEPEGLSVGVLSVLGVLVVVDELVNDDLLTVQVIRNVRSEYRCERID